MAKITITIPEKRVAFVLEMLKKASGKTTTLSNELVNSTGSFFYSFKDDAERDTEFIKRALDAILEGIVKWGKVVKETHRYNMDLENAKDTVKPIDTSIPDDLLG